MKNLTSYVNSKFLKFSFGVITAVFVMAGFAFANTASAASCTISTTLRQGSKGVDVQCLQTIVGVTADGSFGPKTKAAVMAFQASHSLTADGVVGPMTRASLVANGSVSGNFPAGCNSASGFSTTTGQPCTSGPSTGLPAGCSSSTGFSVTTGKSCSGTTTGGTATGPLQGGAGDVTISETSTDVEDKVNEGEDDVKVLGFKVEADDSDVAITSVRVVFKNEGDTDVSSENLEKYVDEVTVWMDDKKVGSADASDFSKDSGDPDEFSKSISISNAVVREDDEAKFYVAVTGASSIDDDDQAEADWNLLAETLRFEDATGAILTADVDEENNFTFGDATEDDKIELKSSSTNPDDSTISVDENDNSDETLALAFKLDVDEDSNDVSITSMTFDVDVSAAGDVGESIDDIIDTLTVDVGGKKFDADFDDETFDGTTGTATYTVDLDDGDLTIDAGDVEEAKVYVTFNDQKDNYAEGTVVKVSLDNENIDAETDEDEITVDGSLRTGADLTLSLSTAAISNVSWTKSESDTTGTLDFFFTVTAEDDDVEVLGADVLDDVTGGTFNDSPGVDSESGKGQLTRVSGDDADSITGGFLVAEGDTVRFRVRYTTVEAGSHEVTITSVAGQEIDEDDQLSPTVTID